MTQAIDILGQNQALTPPSGLARSGMTFWVDEAIWGHRFRNDQSPWLLLIELLNVCSARLADANAHRMFTELDSTTTEATGTHESFTYTMPERLQLRHILFRDHHLDEIANRAAANEKTQWHDWVTRAEKDCPSEQFDYLQSRFDSFEAFANTVRLMRSLEAEPERNRRWTSRHLIPHGPAMLMADATEQKNGRLDSGDRRFFARGGELVFLMLNRSDQRDRLEPLIRNHLLASDKRWNRFADRLQPPKETTRIGNTHIGYLPLLRHPRYNVLAEDWIALLEADNLTVDYALDPLMRLTGLHTALYILERASELTGRRQKAPLVLEMIARGVNSVRKLSTEQFHANQYATREALNKHLESVRTQSDWQDIVAANDASDARQWLNRVFGWTGDDSGQPPEQQFEAFRDHLLRYHPSRIGQIPNNYLQKVGIAIRRQGSGSWYVPYDRMLEALVLANVREPIELRIFMQRLFDRYTIVVGPQEARQAFGEMPVREEELTTNLQRFEERLSALGLLQRLSDDCAFVHNPFINAQSAA